jgi:hypothetical protein
MLRARHPLKLAEVLSHLSLFSENIGKALFQRHQYLPPATGYREIRMTSSSLL